MGKKGRKSGGDRDSSPFFADSRGQKSTNLGTSRDIDDKRPDPKDSDFYHDEVDEFHQDKDKVNLNDLRAARSASSDEEVYKVRVDSDDDDEEEESGDGLANQDEEEAEFDDDYQESDNAVAEDDDMKSDIEDDNDENYLPSADAWGKRKKAFYNTDFVDKDYGGYYSESDEEAAELEEIEAKALQKRLADHVTDDDFLLALPETQETISTKKSTELAEKIDPSKLNDEEKLEYLVLTNPEFLSLIEEFKEKKEIMENQLKPIVTNMQIGKLPETDGLNLIKIRFEAYCNYLLNLHFYFLLKAQKIPTNCHPVIGKIVEWKKIVQKIDEKCQNLNEDLQKLNEILKNPDQNLTNLQFVNKKSIKTVEKSKKSVNKNDMDQSEDEEFFDFEAGNDVTGAENAKRAATYEILKNRGTTPRRKKENRNPRVKHRRKFDKALHKKRSQVPDVKKEWKKYGGEERGIKPNVIKSVKLH